MPGDCGSERTNAQRPELGLSRLLEVEQRYGAQKVQRCLGTQFYLMELYGLEPLIRSLASHCISAEDTKCRSAQPSN